jgi:hypothetical protein
MLINFNNRDLMVNILKQNINKIISKVFVRIRPFIEEDYESIN